MGNLKKIIIIFAILILVIISFLVVLKFKNNQKPQEIENVGEEMKIEESFDKQNKLSKITQRSDYMAVKECINKYIAASNHIERLSDMIPDFVKENLYLAKESNYKNIVATNKSIRIDAIYTSLQTYSEEAYEYTTDIYAYSVEGVLVDYKTKEKEDFHMIVVLDKINSTFFLVPNQYIENNEMDLSEDTNLKLYQEQGITANDNNGYNLKNVTDKEWCQQYFERYKQSVMYDPAYIYEHMEPEYKEKFSNVEDYEKYIQENESEIKSQMAKFTLVKKQGEEQEYICLDQEKNVYIFKENNLLDFTFQVQTQQEYEQSNL